MVKTKRIGMLQALLVAVISLVCGLAATGLFAPQQAWAELGEPAHSKTVEANSDGTYTITLDVTGNSEASTVHQPVDVVLVLDTSGSMEEGGRLQNVQTASNTLINQLLTRENAALPANQQIQVSVVDFNTRAKVVQGFTSSSSAANNAVNALGPGGGTNWEDGLAKANSQSSNRSGAKKYIVFLSDGLPTFRNTGNWWRDDDWNWDYGLWGNGNTDPDGKNATAAVTEANKRGGATLYSVYASAEQDVVKGMTDFANSTNATPLNGTDLDALQKSFAEIASEITNSAAYQNVTITDALSPYVSGTAQGNIDQNSVKYWTTTGGNKTEWAGAPQATVDGGNISWNPSAGCEGGELVKDATYSVSFTVVPNQTAYDYAVDHDGTVPTNASASVSYKAVQKVNGEIKSEKTGSADYDVPTIAIPVSTLTVEKVWADGAEKHASDSVTVNITDNRGKFSKQVTLSAANNWKQDVTVAAGPEGHTYTVEEVAVPGYTATYENQSVQLVGTTTQTGKTTITNNRNQGNLVLTKFVAGSAANLGQHFSFQLECAGLASQTKPVSVTGNDDAHPASVSFDANGNATLQLKHGEVATIGEIDADTQVQVREVSLANTPGAKAYAATDAEKAHFGAALEVSEKGETSWVEADAIPSNGSSYVTFRNTAEVVPDAGISSNVLPMAGLLALAGAGALALVASRVAARKKHGDVWKD